MLLNDFFKKYKVTLVEGGNLQIGDVQADKIDSAKRAEVVPILDRALTSINAAYQKVHNVPLWMPNLLSSKKFLAGSSFHFFNRLEISDADFSRVKRTVGDTDTQVDKNMVDQVRAWLGNMAPGTQIGPAQYVGMDDKDPAQILTLWKFPEIVVVDEKTNQERPITIQIDLEMKPFEGGAPTPWAEFSASSSWEDLSQGIKGVFHKWIIRSLSSLTQETFLLRKIGARKTTEKPTTDNMISFAVKSKEGGGLRAKYAPVIDPATGQPEIKDNLPVYSELPTTGYKQNIPEIFTTIFGDRLPPNKVKALEPRFWSFIGIVELMRDYLSPEEQQIVANGLVDIVFGKGAQKLYKDSPKQDLTEKNVAINKMYEILGIQPPPELKQIISDYTAGYKTQPVTEEAAKPNYARQGIQHLYNRLPDGRVSSMEMRDADFIELTKEIANNGGTFDGIPITLKVDGAGIRFGKDESGRPFFMTSKVTTPLYADNIGYFTDYGKSIGQSDEVLARTKKYDDVLSLIVNSDFIKTLPPDTIVQAEMLYNDMAQNTDGQLKFVSIPYDPKKLGKQITFVPFTAKQYSTGETRPDQDKIIQKLLNSSTSDIKFVTNKLEQQGINVSRIIDPVLNMDSNLVAALATRGTNPQKEQAKKILDQARQELSSSIIDNPKLKGKDVLGDNMEGIVVAMPNGRLFKVTSQQMKSAMSAKMAPQSFGDTNPRAAVVAIGNFAGHRGHEALINFAIQKAQELGGTPFVYVGQKVGEDDPIDVQTKIQTLQKLFPGIHISPVENQMTNTGDTTVGNHMKKIEYELVKKEPFYNNIIIVVGSDAAPNMQTWAASLQKRFSKFAPLAHVKISVDSLARGSAQGGSDWSTTNLRNSLKTKSEDKAFQDWSKAYNVQKLGADWIKHLMDIAKKNMGLNSPNQQPTQQLAEEIELIKSSLIKRILENEFRRS